MSPVLGLVGALLAGLGVHWLITPNDHPGASDVQTISVWIQIVVGVSLIGYAWRAERRKRVGG